MIKILIVLEGERTESDFFESILGKFELNAELLVVGTNLYTLYHKCRLYDFECDVKDVLKEIIKDESKKDLLDQKFTYTYLVFDAELQHKAPDQRGKSIFAEDLVSQNFPKLIEMANHFTDETDPSIGRLYINYPMMESFRYCDDFDDDNHLSSTVSIYEMRNFKQIASRMKLSGISPSKYEQTDFLNLIKMNIKRLMSLSDLEDNDFPLYSTYMRISESKTIAENQIIMVKNNQELYIINTSLFIILDYFGNRNGFYDDLTKKH